MKIDFSSAPLKDAPLASFEEVVQDGVLPDGFFSTTNLPTYVRLEDGWRLPDNPRMDSALVLNKDTKVLEVLEGRNVSRGQWVAVGKAEDGSEGILVDGTSLHHDEELEEHFTFMESEVSREKPVNYDEMVEALIREKEKGGCTVWVLGPAVVHARSRTDLAWLVEHGFVSVLFAGNALATHDIEAALYKTTLGMTGKGKPVVGGHAHHMRALNVVRRAGSIECAVNEGTIQDGVMYQCVKSGVPYLLAGSIRDDGPLPDVETDVLKAQAEMREYAKKATMVIMVATALHGIATGNMLPAYFERDGKIEPLTTVCVDQTEFVVNKMKDRGTHQAHGVVTNAQDFFRIIVSELKERMS